MMCVFCLFGCNQKDDTAPDGISFPFAVEEGIIIEDSFLYSGVFPEDGKDDIKENIPALKVRNNSGKDIQLLRIFAKTDKKEFLFEITTLPAGAVVTAFEKNAAALGEGESIISFTAKNRIDFEKPLQLHSEIFELTEHNGIFNIRNISEKDIRSEIYVYYKKKDSDGNYFGGITFRAGAEGLSVNELKQLPATHFNTQDCEVLFIDFAEE